MKIEITNAQKKFTPITVTLTIESMDELAEMYARMNANIDKVKDSARSGFPTSSMSKTEDLWKALDKIISSFN